MLNTRFAYFIMILMLAATISACGSGDDGNADGDADSSDGDVIVDGDDEEDGDVVVDGDDKEDGDVVVDGDGEEDGDAVIDGDDEEVEPLAPVASDDAFTVAEGGTYNGDLSLLASDEDSDNLTFSLADNGDVENGTLTLNADGTYEYVHDGAETSADSFDYKVCDDSDPALCDEGSVEITITAVNDAPVASDDAFTVAEGGTHNGDLSSLVSDVDNENLTFSLADNGDVENGTLTVNADGSFEYVHDGSETTADSFDYKVCDDGDLILCDEGSVEITITAVNDAPLASEDAFTVAEGGTHNGDLSSLVSDADSDNLTFSLAENGDAANGTLTLNADGTFVYVHDGSEVHVDSFNYKVCDDADPAMCSTATITVDVTPVNDPPVPGVASFTVAEGGTINGDLNNYVVDADDMGSLTFTNPAAKGSIASQFNVNQDGTFAYIHNGNDEAEDDLAYRVCDPSNECIVGYIDVTITPVNDAPNAVEVAFTLLEGGTYNGDLTNYASDTDSDALTFTAMVLKKDVATELIINSNGTFSFTHDGSENFSYHYAYKVCDAGNLCDTENIYITVTPVNDAPVASKATIAVAEGGSYEGDLKYKVSDAEGDDLTFSQVFDKSIVSSLVINADGTYTFNHDGSETFVYSYDYKVCDTSNSCDTNKLVVLVSKVNDAPVASDFNFTINEGASYNGDLKDTVADPDDDVFTFSEGDLKTAVSGLTLNADGTFSFQHDGSENFSYNYTYQVCDDDNACDIATINVTVNPVNDPPVAYGITFDVNEGGSYEGDISLLASDPEGGSLTFSIATGGEPTNGTATVNEDGTGSYNHDGGETTSDAVVYKVCDDGTPSLCSTATVSFTIMPVNDPPVASDHNTYNSADEGGYCINGLINYVEDPDNDSFTFTVNSGGDPAHGSLHLEANGTYRYDHDGSETTSDSFTFKVCDAGGLCDTAVATITINPMDDPSNTVNDEYDVVGNTAIVVDATNGVLANDSDVDSVVTVIPSTDESTAQGGVITINADGSFEYFPPVGARGIADTFTYLVDGPPASATITFNISEHIVWYVDNSAPADGDGRGIYGGDNYAFDTLYEVNFAVEEGDLIVINGTETPYGDNLTLPEGASVVGTGVALPHEDYPEVDFPNLHLVSFEAGTAPKLDASGHAITLRGNNVVMGLDVIDASGNAIWWQAADDSIVGDIFIEKVNFSDISGHSVIIDNDGGVFAGSLTINNCQIISSIDGIFVWNVKNINIDNGLPKMNIVTDRGQSISLVGAGGDSILNVGLANITSLRCGSYGVFLGDVEGQFIVDGNVTINSADSNPVYISHSNANIDLGDVIIDDRQDTAVTIYHSSNNIEFNSLNIRNTGEAPGYGIDSRYNSANITIGTLNIDRATETSVTTDADSDNVPDDQGNGDCVLISKATGTFTVLGGSVENCDDDGFDIREAANVDIREMTIGKIGKAGGGSMNSCGIYLYNISGTTNIQESIINNWDNEPGSFGILQVQDDQDFSVTQILKTELSHSGLTDGDDAIHLITRGNTSGTFMIAGDETDSTVCEGLYLGDCFQAVLGDSEGSTGNIFLGVSYVDFKESEGGRIITSVNENVSLELQVLNSTFTNLGQLQTSQLGTIAVAPNNNGSLKVLVDNCTMNGDETKARSGYGFRGVSIETSDAPGEALTGLNIDVTNNSMNGLPHEAVAIKIKGEHLSGGNVGKINLTGNTLGGVGGIGLEGDYGVSIITSGDEKYMNIFLDDNVVATEDLEPVLMMFYGATDAYLKIDNNSFVHDVPSVYSQLLIKAQDAETVVCTALGVDVRNVTYNDGGVGVFTFNEVSGTFTKQLGTNFGAVVYPGGVVDDAVCTPH